MGIISKILGKKKKVDSDPTTEPIKHAPGKIRQCAGCNSPIYPEEGYTKQMGYYFHRKCWRSAVKNTNI